ncbi:MAG: MMPL family transporter [Thermoplasmatota archaeon]
MAERAVDAVAGAMARVMLASARHARLVIALTLVATLAFAYGLQFVEVRSTDYDLMPDSHPSATANNLALNEVPGYRDAETMWVEVADPSRQNITNETEVRAMLEAQHFIQSRVPELKYTINLADLVMLVNYTASGIPNPGPALVPGLPGPTSAKAPDNASYSMPPDSLTFQRDWTIIQKAAFDTVQAQTDEKFSGALLVFIYDVNDTKAGPSTIVPLSEKFFHAAEAYRDTICPNSAFRAPDGAPVYNCQHVYILGQALNGHMTELAQNDFAFWGPIVYAVTLVILVFAFRDLISTAIAVASFTLGLVWTYGVMGYMHIPLTFFGLLIVPITLGVGKEYAIYVTNQFLEYRAEGLARDEVAQKVGRRAGMALLIASVTSVVGLAAIFLAGFHIMRDLALLSIVAFASLFLLSVTFIPAAHGLRKKRAKRREFAPSHAMGALARGVRNHRVAVIAVVAVATLGLAYSAQSIEEYFGISGGFQPGDYMEQSYQYYNKVLGGSGTELVVIQGDVSDPATLDYLTKLDAQFIKDKAIIPKSSNVNSLMIGLRTYYDLRYGLANPAILTSTAEGDPNANIPKDKATLAHDIKFMYDSPIWAPLVAIFTGPDETFAVTHVFYHIGTEDFAGLEHDWNALNADVNAVPKPPSVKHVDLVGTQDTFYLFVKYGMPWLPKVGVIASALTFVIALVIFRNWRDVGAVMVPMTLASVWWAGLLPLFGIKASMTLMLPTVFLISVGSDYAIQYVWNRREIGNLEEVYRTTGKANLYVVLATTVAFLLFVPMKLVLSSQGALAAALAILCIFTATTLIVPLFYPRDEPARDASGASEPLAQYADAEAPVVGVSR